MIKRRYCSRRNLAMVIIGIIVCVIYWTNHNTRELNLYIRKRSIEKMIEETLRRDKGTGCNIPKLDPYAPEIIKFFKEMPRIVCPEIEWVKCYLSECRVVPEILNNTRDIVCVYKDILYESDKSYVIGPPREVRGAEVYELVNSDHVKVKCTGKYKDDILRSKWIGHLTGFRSTVSPKTPPVGRENSLNVLIFAFDSAAKNGFIRNMPKSYEVLTKTLGATVLNGYNILGDGTPAALFPILTGKNELELPDMRKIKKSNATLDSMPFIFYKLKEYGYRTAYFEDSPSVGTFQYRFEGFKHQPADHYLRDFFLEVEKENYDKYCVGGTPQYKLMIDKTKQFMTLDGKKYCFTFIADICHNDFNMISTADEGTAEFLIGFLENGGTENTLLLVMGDHGPRFSNVRNTLQGRLEERLPLMAVRLPEALKRSRPDSQNYLEMNSDVLTTPHDIYATVLDALDLKQHWNTYRVSGADLTRGLTLLNSIPKNRSCSEAGIEPHWCSCLSWETLGSSDQLYTKCAEAFVQYINTLTDPKREMCAIRTLTSVEWVMRQRANEGVLTFVEAKNMDGYEGKFGARIRSNREIYQLKVVVGPGRGVYEASLTHAVDDDQFVIDHKDISRTNAYNDEPSCISATHPHLNMYCYCKH